MFSSGDIGMPGVARLCILFPQLSGTPAAYLLLLSSFFYFPAHEGIALFLLSVRIFHAFPVDGTAV
jgi:hypothetical protein